MTINDAIIWCKKHPDKSHNNKPWLKIAWVWNCTCSVCHREWHELDIEYCFQGEPIDSALNEYDFQYGIDRNTECYRIKDVFYLTNCGNDIMEPYNKCPVCKNWEIAIECDEIPLYK